MRCNAITRHTAWLGVEWHGALHCKCHILHTRWAAQMSAFEFKFEFEFWISLFGASCCFCLHYFEGKMMMVDLAWLTACLPACMHFIYALANNSTEPEECCRSCSYLGNETPPAAAATPPPPPPRRPSSSYCHHQKLLKRNYGKREMIIEYSNNIMFAWA